jgi:hypothetical protein
MQQRETSRPQRMAAALLVCLCGVAAIARGAGLDGGVRLGLLPQYWQDDSGKVISLAELSGQRVVLTMAYANCHRICPMTIERLKRMQSTFDARGERAEFVIVGYDPENEDFATGSVADTARLARQLRFERWKYDEHVMHDSRVLSFDPHGLLEREVGADSGDWSGAL